MLLETLRENVLHANREIARRGLARIPLEMPAGLTARDRNRS